MAHDTVLITGPSSGIGRELAQCFAADGCCLVLVARRGAALESLAEELRKAHKVDARVVVADLARAEAPTQILGQLQHHGLKVNVLVNNAGFGAQGRFAELPLGRQLEMIQVNVTALTHLSRLLLPDMIKRGRGGILNVASTAAFQPGPYMAVLRTGVGSRAIEFVFEPAYLENQIWFDPDPFARNSPVPDNRIDSVTFFAHEFGHALAFNGWYATVTGALPGDYISRRRRGLRRALATREARLGSKPRALCYDSSRSTTPRSWPAWPDAARLPLDGLPR